MRLSSQKWKTLTVVFMLLLFVLCCTLLSSCSIVHNNAKARVKKSFVDNRDTFEQVVTNYIGIDHDVRTVLFGMLGAQQIDVPQSLSDAGFYEIYLSGGNVYFEWAKEIMGVTPCGIVYISDESNIDKWFKVEAIEDNWYYYIIVS